VTIEKKSKLSASAVLPLVVDECLISSKPSLLHNISHLIHLLQFSQSTKTQTKQPTKPQVMLIRTNYCHFFCYINIPSKNKKDTSHYFDVCGGNDGFPYISLLAPKQPSSNQHDTDRT